MLQHISLEMFNGQKEAGISRKSVLNGETRKLCTQIARSQNLSLSRDLKHT